MIHTVLLNVLMVTLAKIRRISARSVILNVKNVIILALLHVPNVKNTMPLTTI